MIIKNLRSVLKEGVTINVKPNDVPVLPEVEIPSDAYKLAFIFTVGVLVGAGLGLRVKPVMVFR